MKTVSKPVIVERTWDEFRNSGLLWWVNRIIHTFGWAIVMEVGENENISRIYPAKVSYRGFTQEAEAIGFSRVEETLRQHVYSLNEEVKDEKDDSIR